MRNTFDENAKTYSQARPGYPHELYEHVSQFKRFNQDSTLIEIGAGHGNATEEVFSQWGSQITAIEPGKSLFSLGKEKFAANPKVTFVNSTYEAFTQDQQVDGIYAATAFHWLDPSTKFKKSHELLKDDGLLFLYWNYYGLKSDTVFEKIQRIYKDNHPLPYTGKDPRIMTREKILSRTKEVEETPYFEHLNHNEIKYSLSFSAKRYIDLLKTFPNNALEKEKIGPFFSKIDDCIHSLGNSIEMEITLCSEVANKK